MKYEFFDVICRCVRGRGWLYILFANRTEYARGEFQPTAEAALARGLAMAEKLFGDQALEEAA